jgi:Ala-tRNA(Pro) deacylase
MKDRERLIKYLEANKAHFRIEQHPIAFTAQRTAEVEHIPGRRMMKVVMVEAEGRPVMVVVPATYYLDLHKVAAVAGVRTARLAREDEFAHIFPGC